MKLQEFIDIVNICPLCNAIMEPQQLNFPEDLTVIAFYCGYKNHSNYEHHYESHSLNQLDIDDYDLIISSLYVKEQNIIWNDKTTILSVRDINGSNIIYYNYPELSFLDWLKPKSNIINKLNKILLLK